jgi:hypothetical protein
MEGKIVLADRGKCTFAAKALVAEEAGAAALFVANNEGGDAFFMMLGAGEGNFSSALTIPTAMIRQKDGERLRALLPPFGNSSSGQPAEATPPLLPSRKKAGKKPGKKPGGVSRQSLPIASIAPLDLGTHFDE